MLRIILPLSIIIFFRLINISYTMEGPDNSGKNIPIEKGRIAGLPGSIDELRFTPAAGILISGEFYLKNDAGYTMAARRVIDLDILRYRHIILTAYVNEYIIHREGRTNYFDPYKIRYEMDYGSLGWDFGAGVLSLYYDHNCDNIINKNNTLPIQLRWYGGGVRWETRGMRPGRKDVDINFQSSKNFELVNNFYYRISAGKSAVTKYFNYDYMINAQARYDAFRYYFFVPYFEASATGLIDERARVDRKIECGIRVRLDNADLSPYFTYSYKYDVNFYKGPVSDFYFFGLKLESLIGDVGKQNVQVKEKKEGVSSLFPEIHFSASYGKILSDEVLNYNTDFLVDIDLINISGISPFVKSRLAHNSLLENAGMFPRYMNRYFESGISCNIKSIGIFFEPFYRFTRMDESNFYNGYSELYHLAGIRLQTVGMKTGRRSAGIAFSETGGFSWINNFNWSLSSGCIVKNYFYGYSWEHELMLRWDIFSVMKIAGYISGSVKLDYSKNYSSEYRAEIGERIYLPMELTLFYQYRYMNREDPGNGLFRTYHVIGLRMEI